MEGRTPGRIEQISDLDAMFKLPIFYLGKSEEVSAQIQPPLPPPTRHLAPRRRWRCRTLRGLQADKAQQAPESGSAA